MDNLKIELNVIVEDSSAARLEGFEFDLVFGDHVVIMEFINN